MENKRMGNQEQKLRTYLIFYPQFYDELNKLLNRLLDGEWITDDLIEFEDRVGIQKKI